jgi:hypothetical protein
VDRPRRLEPGGAGPGPARWADQRDIEYKPLRFAAAVRADGIDGLVKLLSDKNASALR